jgi:hypothetical protein
MFDETDYGSLLFFLDIWHFAAAFVGGLVRAWGLEPPPAQHTHVLLPPGHRPVHGSLLFLTVYCSFFYAFVAVILSQDFSLKVFVFVILSLIWIGQNLVVIHCYCSTL